MNDALGLGLSVQQTPALSATLRRAMVYAQQRSHRYITLEHLLLALCDDHDAAAMLRSVGADCGALKAQSADIVNRHLSTLYAPGNHDLRPSYKLERILQAASEDAGRSSPGIVDGAFVLAALTSESDSLAAGLLRKHGLGFQQAMSWLFSKRSGEAIAKARGGQLQPHQADWQRQQPPIAERAIEPRLEDMLSSAREMLDAEERVKQQPYTAPPPRQQRPPAGPSAHAGERMRGELRPGAQQAPASPPPGAMPRSLAGRMPPGAPPPRRDAPPAAPPPPPVRERTLTKALEQVGANGVAAEAAPMRNLPAVRADAGKLVENIPRRMREGKAETIEVRISREHTAALFADLAGRGKAEGHDIIVTRAMSLMLRAPEGGFIIETMSPETQWVFDRPSFLETERFGRWRWTVTPTLAGRRKLRLIVSARSVDDHGMAGDSSLPDQIIEVRVRTNYSRVFGGFMRWSFLIIAGAVLGKTAEIFLPGLIAMLK